MTPKTNRRVACEQAKQSRLKPSEIAAKANTGLDKGNLLEGYTRKRGNINKASPRNLSEADFGMLSLAGEKGQTPRDILMQKRTAINTHERQRNRQLGRHREVRRL